MPASETTRDLIELGFDFIGKPKNLGYRFFKNAEGSYCFQKYYIPTAEEFALLAAPYTLHKVKLPDFYSTLKNIIEAAMKLSSFGKYIAVDIQEKYPKTKDEIQRISEGMPFKVFMRDSLSKKDRLKIRKIQQQKNRCIAYGISNENFLFLTDEKADHFFTVMENKNVVIKAALASHKTIQKTLETEPDTFSQFENTINLLLQYYERSRPPYTQKSWDDFALNQRVRNAGAAYQALINPIIMNLVDNTRRFLVETLLDEHWRDIGVTPKEARGKLKKEKSLIYTFSEKFGYIQNAEPFKVCENLRNALAHNRLNQEISIPFTGISFLYQGAVCNFISHSFLKQYYDQFPVRFSLENLEKLKNAHFVVSETEHLQQEMEYFLPVDIQKKNSREKLIFLKEKGVITPEEQAELKGLFLQRNAVAHGQSNETEKWGVSPLILQIQQALIQRQKEYQKE